MCRGLMIPWKTVMAHGTSAMRNVIIFYWTSTLIIIRSLMPSSPILMLPQAILGRNSAKAAITSHVCRMVLTMPATCVVLSSISALPISLYRSSDVWTTVLWNVICSQSPYVPMVLPDSQRITAGVLSPLWLSVGVLSMKTSCRVCVIQWMTLSCALAMVSPVSRISPTSTSHICLYMEWATILMSVIR